LILIFWCLTPLSAIFQLYDGVLYFFTSFKKGLENVEDIKGVIKSRKLNDRQYNDQDKKGKRQKDKQIKETDKPN
jgi:hypothetical protein